MNKSYMKKCFAIAIILALFSVIVVPSTGRDRDVEQSSISPLNDGITLYVGGSGPGNYTKIQDAIDDAVDGDTVFVYSGTYFEYEIKVNKSINLIGEDRNNTIINGRHSSKDVIYFHADGSTLRNFTITSLDTGDIGIIIDADNTYISNCNIVDNGFGGIRFWDKGVDNTRISHCYFNNPWGSGIHIIVGDYGLVRDTTISHCMFDDDCIILSGTPNTIVTNCKFYGLNAYILIEFKSLDCQIRNCTMDSVSPMAIYSKCKRLEINNCTITNCEYGIYLKYSSRKIKIIDCTISNIEKVGIFFIATSKYNLISGCNIKNNQIGLFFFGIVEINRVINCNFEDNDISIKFGYASWLNRFYQNNFINNEVNFLLEDYFMFNFFKNNYWDYWDGTGPYHVWGFLNWDWNPVSEPYDIGGGI